MARVTRDLPSRRDRNRAGGVGLITTDTVGLIDNPVQPTPDHFFTLSPAQASDIADHISNPPTFDGRVPPNDVDMVPVDVGGEDDY